MRAMISTHPTAIIAGDCTFGAGVEVGPHCVLHGPVELGEGVRLVGHVYLQGPVKIGPGTIVYPFACVGFPPQDYKFALGDRTAGVKIGSNTILREHVTIHAATNDRTPTTVGDRVFMMCSTHVGHDGHVGNGVIMVNGAGIAGHARVDDAATLSGAALVHQHVHVGRLAFLSGGTAVSANVPPFCTVMERQRLGGVNLVGMRRAGIPRDQITEVRRAFREVFRGTMPRPEQIRLLRERAAGCPAVAELAEFVEKSVRPICPGMGKPPRVLTTWLHRRRRGMLPDEEPDTDDPL